MIGHVDTKALRALRSLEQLYLNDNKIRDLQVKHIHSLTHINKLRHKEIMLHPHSDKCIPQRVHQHIHIYTP